MNSIKPSNIFRFIGKWRYKSRFRYTNLLARAARRYAALPGLLSKHLSQRLQIFGVAARSFFFLLLIGRVSL